jgi:hypothetical protein
MSIVFTDVNGLEYQLGINDFRCFTHKDAALVHNQSPDEDDTTRLKLSYIFARDSSRDQLTENPMSHLLRILKTRHDTVKISDLNGLHIKTSRVFINITKETAGGNQESRLSKSDEPILFESTDEGKIIRMEIIFRRVRSIDCNHEEDPELTVGTVEGFFFGPPCGRERDTTYELLLFIGIVLLLILFFRSMNKSD